MTRWRTSPAVAVAAVTAFLVIQLAIPITRMGPHEEAQRFGWQMFATFQRPIEFTVHTPSGASAVALEDVLARVRGDLPLDELIPPHLCATVEGAIRVTWDTSSLEC